MNSLNVFFGLLVFLIATVGGITIYGLSLDLFFGMFFGLCCAILTVLIIGLKKTKK